MTCFIEWLTVRAWCLTILPRLVWMRVRGGRRMSRCCVIDASRLGLVLARLSQWVTGVTVEPLRFRLVEVRDEQGLLIRLRIAYQDLGEVQREMMTDPSFREAVSGELGHDRFPGYLAKAIATHSLTSRQILYRALLVVQVCHWHLRKDGRPGREAVFFMERRIWFHVIARYAQRNGITAIPVPRSIPMSAWRRRLITPGLKRVLYRLQVYGVFGGRRLPVSQWSTLAGVGRRAKRPSAQNPVHSRQRPRVAVEFHGTLNLDHPGYRSDMIFWQQGGISGRDVLITFNLDSHPLDTQTLAELQRHRLDAVAMRPCVAATPDARVFVPRLRGDPRGLSRSPRLPGGLEGQWLRERVRNYYREGCAFWSEFFEAEGIKVYVTGFRYTETHCAIADALKRVGGVATIYQWAYESFPSAETAVMADVFFVYSHAMAEVERRSGSQIPYLVVTGYLGDHRFAFLREGARQLRQALQRRGARRVLAFADENSADDERWHTGHEVDREHYAFLLNRVLEEPWLGLVLKPKTPATLRRRLGPVAELLKRAEATGRCVMFGQGANQSSHPPAAAALASDLMIHGHLNAGTAGLDAALAGVPTLLVDRLGWSVSPLYRLGVGRVVFTDWEVLWKACLEHWRRPGGIPGFGDWSPMLDELDPFRDGRAAERMGTYLRWLLEGFQAGLDRDTVMADVAERYGTLWGRDKIAHVNTEPNTPFHASDEDVQPLPSVGEAC